jgi:DNA repair exonuclease SbcCD ATPase subunit
MKMLIPWLVALVALGAAGYSFNQTKQANTAVATLQQQVADLQAVKAENETLKAAQVSSSELERLRQDSHELLKLRNEVQQLHTEQTALKSAAQAAQNSYQAAQAQAQAAQAQLQTARQAAQQRAAQQQATLAAQPASAEAMMNGCINNLRQIDAAKNQWALEKGKTSEAIPKEEDLTPYLKGNALPTCPAGGTYTLNALDKPPTCSIEGHVLP